MEVEEWITNTIELPQYCVVFMQNELVSMDIIREITDESELRQIGIQNVSHQCLIMSEIRKLHIPEYPLQINDIYVNHIH